MKRAEWSDSLHYVSYDHALAISEDKINFSHDGLAQRKRRINAKLVQFERLAEMISRNTEELFTDSIDLAVEGWL